MLLGFCVLGVGDNDQNIYIAIWVILFHDNDIYHNIQVHLNKLECRGKVHLFQ